jgi:hypothetical protein
MAGRHEWMTNLLFDYLYEFFVLSFYQIFLLPFQSCHSFFSLCLIELLCSCMNILDKNVALELSPFLNVKF